MKILTCFGIILLLSLSCKHVNYLDGFPPLNPDSTINIVVEIPAGTNAKYEVTKPDGRLRQDAKDGKPRVIAYLGYPGNYGMIPRTLLPRDSGGDGDPLDVILLGGQVERGTVVKGKLIGMLKLQDGGEQDDKLIAVLPGSALGSIKNIDELDSEFPGITGILETWFLNYKGPGIMTSSGFGSRKEAKDILNQAIEAYAGQK